MNNSAQKLNIIPIILSGGSGTRLWPLSRAHYPKQYLKIDENDEYSLLQKTIKRLDNLNNSDDPIIICNEEQRFIVAEQMRQIEVDPKSILLEPIGRNTGPAIVLAALKAHEQGQDPLLLILSADHEIKDGAKFINAINNGVSLALRGELVTFGVKPYNPETGYGYIESEEKLSDQVKESRINKFIEKPQKEVAKELIKDNHYTWNSGIFLFKTSTIINEFLRFEPKIVKLCRDSLKESSKDLSFQRININSFKRCPNISIDKAIMEKTSLGRVVFLDAGWSDIGSWKSVWENSEKDINGNSQKGKILINNAKNCYLRSEERLLVGIGIENLIIIETNDAVLVVNKDSSQRIKEIVKDLEKSNIKEGKLNKKIYRPWGSYTSIVDGDTWQVKRLEIKSNESLSLQLHNYRSEHWVVVKGTAHVEIDGTLSVLNENESIYVPLGSKHRLSNIADTPLIIIEVQNGSYLGEDDIQRFDDKYGRTLNL